MTVVLFVNSLEKKCARDHFFFLSFVVGLVFCFCFKVSLERKKQKEKHFASIVFFSNSNY